MQTTVNLSEYDLAVILVKFGRGSKALNIIKREGLPGGTILLGTRVNRKRFFELLNLSSHNSEIIFCVGESHIIRKALRALSKEYFTGRNRGLAFSAQVDTFMRATPAFFRMNRPSFKIDILGGKDGKEMDEKYQSVFVVVNKGTAEEVIDAATAAGAGGGTIINARGAGIHEKSKIFSMTIEPEKEVVIILAKENVVSGIIESVRQRVHIDEPGTGVLFVLDVKETFGIR